MPVSNMALSALVGNLLSGSGSIYVIASLLLIIGPLLGYAFQKIRLTEVLAYLFAGVLISLMGFKAPGSFFNVVTSVTLALVGYIVGLSFSYDFLKRMGKKVMIILIVEVIITFFVVLIFVYLFTGDLALAVLLGSLAPATAPAGTIAVFRSLSSHGILTDVATAVVGLDDAAGIVMYVVGIIWTKGLLGYHVTIVSSVLHALWEIFGAFLLGGAIGLALSYAGRKASLNYDQQLIAGVAAALMGWGLAYVIGVSNILTTMVVGMTVINIERDVGVSTYKTIDSFMTPVYILFFGVIGMEINFGLLAALWAVAVVYCLGRTVGKIIGCSVGSLLARAEEKLQKYLGVALLNQAGVAVGLAAHAAQEISSSHLGSIIITLIAVTTAIFQIASPLGTQYAVKKAGEAQV